MEVQLLDGTYELFRYFYGQPSHLADDGREVAATRGVLGTIVSMLESGVTHMGVATDHYIESFRNDLWPGYKTGEGVDPALFSQFDLLEDGVRSLGIVCWPMQELEADDGLASAAASVFDLSEVERVVICSPDKDLAQCVRGDRVIQRNRRTETDTNEQGVWERFGVAPASIPDWLALVGDSADGFPGLSGWGKRSASLVLAHYGRIEAIPLDASDWDVELRKSLRGAIKLADRLAEDKEAAMLFRDLATLRCDAPVLGDLDELEWSGPQPDFVAFCKYLGTSRLVERVKRLIPHL